MQTRPVPLSPQLRNAVLKEDFHVGEAAVCEAFSAGAAGFQGVDLCCVYCTQPLSRDAQRSALGAIVGGTNGDRERLRAHLVALVRQAGLHFPDARLAVHTAFVTLVVDWAFRGELRAVLAQTASTWAARAAGGAAGAPAVEVVALQERPRGTCAEVGFVSSLPGDDAGTLNQASFRDRLVEFGLAFDGPARAALRKLIAADHRRTWHFPLGCQVIEAHGRRGVTWTLQFEDLELLERAHVLLNPVMREMARMGSRLRPDDAVLEDLADDVLTTIPSLCITTEGNTQQARVEMVRLIKDLILTLDRLGICGEPEDAPA